MQLLCGSSTREVVPLPTWSSKLSGCHVHYTASCQQLIHGYRLTRVHHDRLMDKFEVPLIPLQSIEELPVTLMKFHRSFLQSDTSTRQRPVQGEAQALRPGALQSLLPYCAISPPLGEHSVNLLSDLTIGFADLAHKANSEAGQTKILDYFGQEEAERIILFWTQEYLL